MADSKMLPVTAGSASPAAYLRSARSKVSPDRFALAIDALWQKAEKGDVQAFNAVVPYLTGKLQRDETDSRVSIIDNLLKVVERRQQQLAETATIEADVEYLPHVGQSEGVEDGETQD